MTGQNSLHILLIDDNRCDARSLKEHLAEVGASEFRVTQVDRLATAIELVAGQKPDVVLLALSLPDSRGLETLIRMHAAANDVPIVVLTSIEDEALGLTLIQAGAQDYLVKGQVTGALLTRSLRHAIERARREAALEHSKRVLGEQTRLLRSILCSMGEGVVVVDEEGAPVLFNPAAERILGLPPEEVSPANWIEQMGAVCPDRASRSPRANLPLLHVLRGDEVNNVEVFVRRTGEHQGPWLSVSTRKLEGDNGTACGQVVVFHDVTRHKLVEAALRDSEHRLRSLIESAQDIMLTVSKDAVITSLNPAFERLTGWTCNEWIGKPFGGLLHPDDLQFTADLLAHTMAEREVLTAALHLRMREGGYLTVEATIVPHVNGDRVIGMMGIMRDITERKRAEEALRDHAERLRSIVESTKDAIVLLDQEGKVAFWNKGAQDMFGYSVPEIVGRPMTLVIPARFREAHERGIKRAVTAGRLTVTGNMFELFGLRKDGTEFPLELTITAWRAKSGLFFTGILRDITERRRAEAEREKLLNDRLLLLESTGEGIYGLDQQGRCTFINKAGARMLGYQPEEVIGKNMHALIHHHRADGSPYPSEDCRIYAAFLKGEGYHVENEMMWRKDGTAFPVEYSSFPVSERGVITGAVVTFTDITERKRAEEQLQTTVDQLRSLSRRLEVVREEERRRIARELHDQLGVALTCLKFDLRQLSQSMSMVDKHSVRVHLQDKIHSMVGPIDNTIGLVQRIVTELRPGVLDDLGLVAALEWLVRDFQQRTGIASAFSTSLEDIEVGREVATAVFRICQEALTNVARHARATEVMISLEQTSRRLLLEVKDNGQGIPAEKVADAQSLGLLGMRERAGQVGGRLIITSRPGEGATLTLSLPKANSQQPIASSE